MHPTPTSPRSPSAAAVSDLAYASMPTALPAGWVPARYETATHAQTRYVFGSPGPIRDRWMAYLAQKELDRRLSREHKEARARFPELACREDVIRRNWGQGRCVIKVETLDRMLRGHYWTGQGATRTEQLLTDRPADLLDVDARAFCAIQPAQGEAEVRYRRMGAELPWPARTPKGDAAMVRMLVLLNLSKGRSGCEIELAKERAVTQWCRIRHAQALATLATLPDTHEAREAYEVDTGFAW